MKTYSDGKTVPEVGDLVECLSDGLHQIVIGGRHSVTEVSGDTIKVREGFGYMYSAHFFKLISRKEQPAVNPMPAQPLVVWPEEGQTLYFDHLKSGELFVVEHDKYRPRVKISDGEYRCLIDGSVYGISKSIVVRRIQFNPANKEPVFTVI